MIRQGSNQPIVVTFTSAPESVSINLCNEIRDMKHWSLTDLEPGTDELEYIARYPQEESMGWDEGPCRIEIRWTDSDGIIHREIRHDYISYTQDKTILQ